MLSNGSYQTFLEMYKFDDENLGQITNPQSDKKMIRRGPVLCKFTSSNDSMSAKAKALELEIEYILVFNGIVSLEGSLDSYQFWVRRNYNDMVLVPIDYPRYINNKTEIHCLEQEDERIDKNTDNSMGTW